MLSYNCVRRAAITSKGINDESLLFEHVSSEASVVMPKGLFIPSSEKELYLAIHQGAIASFWQEGEELPAWLPNHFPLFIAENVPEAVLLILDEYYYNTKQEEWGTMTKFIFREKELGKLNKISNQQQYSGMREAAEKALKTEGGE